jgi:hypothetical protein
LRLCVDYSTRGTEPSGKVPSRVGGVTQYTRIPRIGLMHH